MYMYIFISVQPRSDTCGVGRRLFIVEPCLSSAAVAVAPYCILRFSFALEIRAAFALRDAGQLPTLIRWRRSRLFASRY